MKAICMMSEPANADMHAMRYEKDKLDIAFHTHIPYLIECGKSIKHSYEFKNYALQTLSNLSVREYLKPYILYNDGLGAFVEALRNENNVNGRRIAAKALVNITHTDSKGRFCLPTLV